MIDQDTTPSSPSSPPATVNPSCTRPHKNPLMMLVCLLIVAAAITVAAIGGYNLSDEEAKKDITALNSQLAVLKANTQELPPGAFKVSDCIPNMGSHYIPEGADPQYGPFILVNKAGKVIGTEFMASEDMYTAIPGVVPPVEILAKNSPLYGWKYDHAELSHTPEGHEGFLKDHFDVHLYTVTPEQQKQACN